MMSDQISRGGLGRARGALVIGMGLWMAVATGGCAAGLSLHAGGAVAMAPTAIGPEHPGPAGGGARAGASVEVHIAFFGIPLDGADDVVFVLDRSGSMSGVATGFSGRAAGMSDTESTLASLGGTVANAAAGHPLPSKLEVAKHELLNAVARMPDGTRLDILFFDDEIDALSRGMVVLGPATRARVRAFIRGIRPGGSTAAVPALDLAYRIGAARVVLLSDGLANTGGDGGDLLARAQVQMRRGVRFDTVGIGLDQDGGLLQSLARDSGGMAVMR